MKQDTLTAIIEDQTRRALWEVKNIIDGAYQEARRLLKEKESVLHACAALLIEKEKIGREEFEALFS